MADSPVAEKPQTGAGYTILTGIQILAGGAGVAINPEPGQPGVGLQFEGDALVMRRHDGAVLKLTPGENGADWQVYQQKSGQPETVAVLERRHAVLRLTTFVLE